MIVDDPEKETDLAADPFLKAGIDIPKELPYQTPLLPRKKNGSIFGSSIFRASEQGDNLSRASSVVSLAKATANTMVNKKPLKNFKKHFRPKTNTKYTFNFHSSKKLFFSKALARNYEPKTKNFRLNLLYMMISILGYSRSRYFFLPDT